MIKFLNSNIYEFIDINYEFNDVFHITYVNFYSYKSLRTLKYNHLSEIRIDGILLVYFLNFLTGKSFNRHSFDFTSDASIFFDFWYKSSKQVTFIGGNEDESSIFKKLVDSKYINNNWKVYSGFLSDTQFCSWIDYFSHIKLSSADVVVLALGTPLQEEVSRIIFNNYDGISTITCGGFITQSCSSLDFDYYPSFFNKYNLRWLYRIYKEKHVLKRVLIDYPISIIYFLYDYFYRDRNVFKN